MSLVHVIFLYKENIPIFVGCCQAIAEILQKSDSFALTLFDRGVHLQVRTDLLPLWEIIGQIKIL